MSDSNRQPQFICLRCRHVSDAPGLCPIDRGPTVLNRDGELLAGRYRLSRPLVLGGSGVLWEAEQLSLGRPVAVRLVSAQDAGAAERVRRGASVMARMAHVNIVTLHDFGEHDSEVGTELFLVMERLVGQPLKRYCANTSLSIEHAVSAAVQTLRALQHLHAAGYIHRDIKPANIFVTSGDDDEFIVKLLDFTIARGSDAATTTAPRRAGGSDEARAKRKITRAMRILGTPEYMAPEQILGRSLDARVDLYAVGVMLFNLLIGQLPFRGEDRIQLYEAHLRTAVPALNDYMMATPQAIEEWQAFFEQALAKLPDQRFPDARSMRRALVKLPRVNFLTG